jgi:hypothetical protein
LFTYGHVPHPVGMWTESMMKRPPLKSVVVSMRMLCRVSGTFAVVSTRMTILPSPFMSRRPLLRYRVGRVKECSHVLGLNANCGVLVNILYNACLLGLVIWL